MTNHGQTFEVIVPASEAGQRLDLFLALRCTQHSRVRLRQAIAQGNVLVDQRRAKPAYRLRAGQTVEVALPELEPDVPPPEPIAIDVLYEDEALIAINKPAGMVVHPSKGHRGGTLVNALAHHFQQLSRVGGTLRPGIVHRLDRDTSGVIIVAKTDAAHQRLAQQWRERTIEKEYIALLAGVPDRDRDVIDQPLGMHPYQREKMAIRTGHSSCRDAVTFYEVRERWVGFSLVGVFPKTGRTHQIRVHLAHIGCPVLCDRIYGGRSCLSLKQLQGPHSKSAETTELLLDRQALHARRLRLQHPLTDAPLEFTAPVPADFQATWEALRRWRSTDGHPG